MNLFVVIGLICSYAGGWILLDNHDLGALYIVVGALCIDKRTP